MMLREVVMPRGALRLLAAVLFRGERGDSPALLLKLDEAGRATLIVFDRGMTAPVQEAGGLVDAGNRPAATAYEILVLGRIADNVPQWRPGVSPPCWAPVGEAPEPATPPAASPLAS